MSHVHFLCKLVPPLPKIHLLVIYPSIMMITEQIRCLHPCWGLLLTYGLATRHACYAPASRPLRARYAPLRARYAPSIYMCGFPKTRRYLLNKSNNTIIWRLNIRQVNKDLYVEVESPRQVVNQWENVWKCADYGADYSMKKNCWKYSKTCDEGTLLYPGQSVPTWQVPSSQVCPNNMKTPYFKMIIPYFIHFSFNSYHAYTYTHPTSYRFMQFDNKVW